MSEDYEGDNTAVRPFVVEPDAAEVARRRIDTINQEADVRRREEAIRLATEHIITAAEGVDKAIFKTLMYRTELGKNGCAAVKELRVALKELHEAEVGPV